MASLYEESLDEMAEIVYDMRKALVEIKQDLRNDKTIPAEIPPWLIRNITGQYILLDAYVSYANAYTAYLNLRSAATIQEQ